MNGDGQDLPAWVKRTGDAPLYGAFSVVDRKAAERGFDACWGDFLDAVHCACSNRGAYPSRRGEDWMGAFLATVSEAHHKLDLCFFALGCEREKNPPCPFLRQ